MAKGKIEKRGAKRRKVKPIVLIVTEGSQTEPKYFEHFKTRQNNIDIRVVGSRSSAGETDYVSLVRKAREYQERNQLSSSTGDSVWVIADADVNYNNPKPMAEKNSKLNQARKMADNREINLLLSSPCFEFWFLLHYQYTTRFIKDYADMRSLLQKYIPVYTKTADVYELINDRTKTAVANAKRAEQHHLQAGCMLPFGVDVNPFTDVYKLMEKLL